MRSQAMMCLLALQIELDEHPCRERDKSSQSSAKWECLSQGRARYNVGAVGQRVERPLLVHARKPLPLADPGAVARAPPPVVEHLAAADVLDLEVAVVQIDQLPLL